jgi:hypothetical protein
MTKAEGIRVIPEFTVSAVPASYPEHHIWTIVVRWRGTGWAVAHMEYEFSRTSAKGKTPRGTWRPRNRKPFRFATSDEALAVAKAVARKVSVNDKTAAQYMAWYDERVGK